LYTADFQAALARLPAADAVAAYYEKNHGADVLTKMLYADLKTWLVDDLLIKADRMTMANSVELRVPFLDYRVVQYAATIPSSMKLHQGKAKWILKRAMKGRLPRVILRRAKRGFPTPLAAMFRCDLLEYLRDVLLSPDSVNRGYFRREAVAALIDEHARSVSDHHRVLWQLLVLEEWHKRFIDHNPVYTEPSRGFISGR
jgi:asparagine synthase (glutamine-hydrolysing)